MTRITISESNIKNECIVNLKQNMRGGPSLHYQHRDTHEQQVQESDEGEKEEEPMVGERGVMSCR
jgi:hypothetical protein